MRPKIKAAWEVSQSTNGQRCWTVAYEFCERLIPLTVYARDESEARTVAANRLEVRGLHPCF